MNSREFRHALGQFPTGVVIATARSAGRLMGMTLSSFNSVSLEPPLVLFSVLRQARGFAEWQAVDRYAINVLTEDQEKLSNQFAGASGDKWDGVSPGDGDSGVPTLPNAAVVFECAAHAQFDGGDHVIFVGRVTAMHQHAFNRGRPLVFFAGRYRQLADPAGAHSPPHESMLLHGW